LEELENALYVVAGPIGNLADITERAKYILSQIDLVACEDSRVTGRLLSHLGFKKTLLSCNAHNEAYRSQGIIKALEDGKKVAYLSDAGTPGISDPGNLLVDEVQKAGFKIIPLPGPSSLTALLSVCGFNLSKGFHFAGFFPRTDGKARKLLQTYIEDLKVPLVLLESPHRIKKTINLIASIYPTAQMCLARELTKYYEQIIRGSAQEVANSSWPEKGEFIFIVYKSKKASQQELDE
jgi:16S rRNA (cytidine1402-2'-O)-methyltransferase